MGVIPVVTRFLCPPETPLCISSPTNVSAQTSSPNICNTTFDSVAEVLELLITRRVCPELFPRCSDQEAYLQHIICDKASLFTANRCCLKTERKANLITIGLGNDRHFELFGHEEKLYNIEYLHKSINISIWFYASCLFPSR